MLSRSREEEDVAVMLRLQISASGLEVRAVSWLRGRSMVKGLRSWSAVEEQRVAVRVMVEAAASDGRARRGEAFILDGWALLRRM